MTDATVGVSPSPDDGETRHAEDVLLARALDLAVRRHRVVDAPRRDALGKAISRVVPLLDELRVASTELRDSEADAWDDALSEECAALGIPDMEADLFEPPEALSDLWYSLGLLVESLGDDGVAGWCAAVSDGMEKY